MILQNPYYVEIASYAGGDHEGRHEPLIDRATFLKAKAVLAAHSAATEKDRKHHHYLKGSLFCGRCGSRMSLTYAQGNGGRYAYFFWGVRRHRLQAATCCGGPDRDGG